MANTKIKILIDTYEMARRLSSVYISKLEGLDINKQYEINGVKMNSAYWIVAHLAWTEHFLIIEGVGGDSLGIEWLNDFCFGSSPGEIKYAPPYSEVLKTLGEIHTKAIEILNNLSDVELEEENNINANFGGKTNKEVVIMHAIWHEPMHIGQLSWILKANGIKMA
jgi:hypothetical protein